MPIRIGMWAWGSFTVALGVLLLTVLIWAGLGPGLESNPYKVVSANNGIFGPLLAASALIWSWFFKTHIGQQARTRRAGAAKPDPIDGMPRT